MTVIVNAKTELVVPRSVRRRAGIKVGDKLEFKVSGGVIHIVPKLPSADDEYTPRQRAAVDRALAVGLEDIQKDRLRGPFETHGEMIEFLHRQTKSGAGKTPRTSNKVNAAPAYGRADSGLRGRACGRAKSVRQAVGVAAR
jgi:bifunctional DNA-binding transcriptional regulator/antitoxin component of YhaV-PrlF toxin-antitoxin module